ncbi:MAG: lytic transglycosylase domain-containing protein [Rickettsiaceae bacterium]|nr:lytic transglycosylase domain-containing protein [Rickettsiaceae bacterium]
MRILKLLSIILLIIISHQSFAEEKNVAKKAFSLIKLRKWIDAEKLASKTKNSALLKIVQSQKFLDKNYKNNSFIEITKFLDNNPNWPQQYLLKIKAENNLTKDTDKKVIFEWFSKQKPVTAKGYKYYALAAAELIDDPATLIPIIKNGWIYGNFTLGEQKKYRKRFTKYLSHNDHVKKIDNYLFNKQITAARQSLYLVNSGYKKSFKAQIALIGRSKKSVKLFKAVAKKYYTDGLIYQYLNSQKSNPPAAKEIIKLVNKIENKQEHANRFYKVLSYISREYIEKKKFKEAYKVINSHFAISPADYSGAEFLSGWLALRFLNKPKLAIEHFYNFNRVVATPVSRSRGTYWLARAYGAQKNYEKANELFKAASRKYPYTFHGQLAAYETSQVGLSLPGNIKIANYKDQQFEEDNDVVQALNLILKYGSTRLSEIYIKSVINSYPEPKQILAIAASIDKNANLHHKAWFGKYAQHKKVFIKNYTYPVPYKTSNLPIEGALTYSIIRQESVFDQYAISSAQAKGLMQLVNDTACDTAKSINMKCSIARVTKDPKYNMILGSHYLKELIQEYKGSYILAIAAYNAGPHRVERWLKIHDDPRSMKNIYKVIDWIELMPFYETRDYVHRILANLQVYRYIISKKNRLRIRQDLMKLRRI